MAKPVSEIEIVNLGLLQLHQGGITSFQDDNDPAALAALRIMAACRRSVLRNHVWNFAKKRYTAAKVNTAAPTHDFTTYYQMPSDLIRLLWVGEDSERYDPRTYDIEGRYILTNDTSASIPLSYICDVEDVSLWDALFVEVMILEVAERLCMPVTGSKGLLQQLRERKVELLKEALSVDHQERPLLVTENDYVREARATTGEVPQLIMPDGGW